jgi:hypothetical protein
MDYYTSVEYPGEFPHLKELIEREHYRYIERYVGKTFDRDLMKCDLQPVRDFYEQHNHPQMYCGEYGVVNCAGKQSRYRWIADLKEEFISMGIAHAVWDYKEDPRFFSMIDPVSNDTLDEGLVKILAQW